MKRILHIFLKSLASLLLFAVFLIIISSISPIYNFAPERPFSGPNIFNPYKVCSSFKDSIGNIEWKRANFHTHTRVKGPFNECESWPGAVYDSLASFGYDIITFSNHNELTIHPFDPALQVNVYEHGYNLLKYHKLVFGCDKVLYFDQLLPITASQRQFQIDLLSKSADILCLNHPYRTPGSSPSIMARLTGYKLIELDSGVSTEQEYWDKALSAGHYSFALANDDLHYPDRTNRIAVRCNFLACQSPHYSDLLDCLLSGAFYCMRIPDYGNGDWDIKHERNRNLPCIKNIDLDSQTIYMDLDRRADSIKVVGQNHITLDLVHNSDKIRFSMPPDTPYARLCAYFPDGEVIYTNPFARYDSSISDSPYIESIHDIRPFASIAFNLGVIALAILLIFLIIQLWKRQKR